MRRIRQVLIVMMGVCLLLPEVSAAIGTQPTIPPSVDGPFIISAYSFQGHSLRYVQIANTSNEVASLDGWKVQTEWDTEFWQAPQLSGSMRPGSHTTVADVLVLPSATFPFTQPGTPVEPRLETIRLVSPTGSGWLDSVVEISIKDSGSSMTPRDASASPEIFYFSRNVSSSTGNYLSSFTATDTPPDVLASDSLYAPPTTNPLQIVEIYPNAPSCSPADTSLLCGDYVKLFNASTQPVDMSEFRIRTGVAGQSSTNSNTSYAANVLAAGAYVAVPLSISDSGNYVWLEDAYGTMLYEDSVVDVPSSAGRDGMAWAYNSHSGAWQWTKYPSPDNQPNSFGPNGVVNQCKGLRLSEIGANYDAQFIEVYNAASEPLDLSGCQIQTNRSQVASYIFSPGTILPTGGLRAIMINKTPLTLTKSTSGTVYVISSDGATEVDARSYADLDDNTSFALVGGKWQQTFAVTPNGENKFEAYPPCQAGYTRNTLTGRCNKDSVVTGLAACAPGQYRNPETNRCKSLTSTSSSLVPCGPGEFRNPETNRCKSLASAANTLAPCADGYERNPETNRCRKVQDGDVLGDTAYPVEPYNTSGNNVVAWLTMGAVVLFVAGYGAWEWRQEIAGGFNALRRSVTRAK